MALAFLLARYSLLELGDGKLPWHEMVIGEVDDPAGVLLDGTSVSTCLTQGSYRRRSATGWLRSSTRPGTGGDQSELACKWPAARGSRGAVVMTGGKLSRTNGPASRSGARPRREEPG